MPKKKGWIIWLIIFLAVIVLAVAYYYGAVREESDREPASYSVILYQNMDNEWATLLEGVGQAEEDYKVNVNYITMGAGATPEEQMEILKREADNGVDGIILAATDSEKTGELLEELNPQVPVITVETGVESSGESYARIAANDYEMGYALGEIILGDIAEDNGPRAVTVIREYMERDSVRLRFQGLMDALEDCEEEIKVDFISRSEGDFNLSLLIGASFHFSSPYIAALDKFCTESAAAAWESKKADFESNGYSAKIYGIGNTAQTVNDLDNERIRALVFQNEFNMGYEGIRALAEKEKKGYFPDEFDIRYKIVTRDTLYEPENERLLFPNV